MEETVPGLSTFVTIRGLGEKSIRMEGAFAQHAHTERGGRAHTCAHTCAHACTPVFFSPPDPTIRRAGPQRGRHTQAKGASPVKRAKTTAAAATTEGLHRRNAYSCSVNSVRYWEGGKEWGEGGSDVGGGASVHIAPRRQPPIQPGSGGSREIRNRGQKKLLRERGRGGCMMGSRKIQNEI